MYKKSGNNYIVKTSKLCYSISLSAESNRKWLGTQRPLIENVINFFNDRQMVNEGVSIKLDWDSYNKRWYHIEFENIDDATLFEITYAEFF
tara:strand:- start:339 stop:611 length:273 start_codon:yes stop_codon:yes gene_type:complete